MRLKSLEVAGFRGFATKQTFDLDADAVIVVGANGNGKTSLFDAVLWAISGRIPRLGNEDTGLVCRFAGTGHARVVLQLGAADGSSQVTITRVFDGERTTLSVETPEGVTHGPQAEGQLIELVWNEAAMATSPSEALSTVLTRSVYLQQDLVRQFIDSVTEHERFTAVSELVGAGRVTELQGELERQKVAWTRATNARSADLQPLRARVSAMESRLVELKARQAPTETGFDEAAWDTWWGQLQTMGISTGLVPITAREAPAAIDAAIKQLDGQRRVAERRQQQIESLIHDLTGVAASPKPDPAPLRSRVALVKQQVESARAKVSAEQTRVAEMRRLQADLQERSDQLRALAALALKNLGNKCPVCDQGYDMDGTRRRLEALAESGPTVAASLPDTLPDLLTALAFEEKALSTSELDLRRVEQDAREREAVELAIAKRFEDLGLALSSVIDQSSALADAAAATVRQIQAVSAAQKSGESFALRLSQAGDQAAIQEHQKEIETALATLQQEDKDLQRRTETGDQAQQVIEALREATTRVVTERVKEIEPLLGEIYSRIDVHPAFRVVKLLASIVRGRGQLATVVSDPLSEIECDSPGLVLSSSQMNALAVCMFLSLNLGIARPPLEAAILDDPLQSLDDINLLGLIDLLRRTKDQRQLCVSTHDVRFGSLMARKLRPRTSKQRTIVIELDGWTRTGPTVSTHEVSCDPAPIRLIPS
jgi:DNA repair exonuclease SbcCD ATPase subunit